MIRRHSQGVVLAAVAFAALVAQAAPVADKGGPDSEVDGRNWAAVGRTHSENRYSPLAEINRDTVPRLTLAWTLDLDVTDNTSTPLAVDGVLYVASGYSVVHAVDAKAGKLLWRYDPEVGKAAGARLRAGWGIRGLASSKGRLFVGTHDGRLIALDAKTGKAIWTAQTLEASDMSFISGAPRVFNDRVVIGSEAQDGLHSAVSAFDANDGKPLWRWSGDGAVSNAIAYDAESDRLYVAASPLVVALNAQTGAGVWKYAPESGPGGSGSTGNLVLATFETGGASRKAVLLARDSGAFVVLDRADGKPVSTGDTGARDGSPGLRDPAAQSFSPKTGLSYVPITTIAVKDGVDVSGDPPADAGKSFLTAWDPLKQRAVWQQPTPGPYNGGTLATGGDLVFQGQADGYINGFGAADGRRVWSFYAATAALGAPITYAIGKQQFVSILTGPLSGAAGGAGSMTAKFGWDFRLHPRRLLTFTLDGKAKLPATPGPTPARPLDGAEVNVDEALAKDGAREWIHCAACHGAGAVAAGGAPDLRAAPIVMNPASFATVVKGGLETRGMPRFAEATDAELDALRNFIRQRARLITRPNGVAPPPEPVKPADADKPPPPREPDKPPGSLESTGTPPPNSFQGEPP